MKIIEILAIDWAFHSDPYSLPDTFPPLDVRAIGFLVEDHPDYVSIAMQDYTHEGRARVRDILSIPRSCIKAIYEYDKPIAGTGLGRPPNIKLGTKISRIESKNIIGGY